MLAPTPRAIALMLMGLPVFMAVAILAPGLWGLSGAWAAGLIGLIFADLVLAARSSAISVEVEAPKLLFVGAQDEAALTIKVKHGPLPVRMSAMLETNTFLQDTRQIELQGWSDRQHRFTRSLTPERRGEGRLETLWLNWTGPMGLVQIRRVEPLYISVAITPNTRWVKEEAVRLYTRDADFGIKMQQERGDGSEFDSLRDFTTGMDRRAIDWKHSARHRSLLAKEFRTERNHNIVFAFDCGRLMCEPLRGIPKIDRAINAALLLAYVSLRSGDKTALFGFDSHPKVTSNVLSGSGSFPYLQQLAARLDYSTSDANYTLALTSLATQLQRRSLIVLFTDFVDTVSAELMLENVKRLLKRHVILFACFEDEQIGDMIEAEPVSADEVSRAAVADGLLLDRELVLRKLEHLGVHVLETRPERFGSELVSRYLEIKRRELV